MRINSDSNFNIRRPGYNDIRLCGFSSITLDTLRYQLIYFNHNKSLLAYNNTPFITTQNIQSCL